MRRDVTRSHLLLAGVVAGLLTLAACGSSNNSTPSGSGTTGGGSGTGAPVAAGTGIKTASTGIGTVLTNSKGFTLYWFAPDTKTQSKCNGSCATFWPPVAGPVSAASGVNLPGTFGTIKRSDGTTQATYDGHPLYTYTGDSAPGMTNGNGLTLSGGKWHAVTPSGSMPAGKPSPSKSSSGGGGGYSY